MGDRDTTTCMIAWQGDLRAGLKRRPLLKTWHLWLASLWLWAAAAGAQESPPLPDLRPGHVIRVEARTVSGRLEGRFEQYTHDSLILRHGSDSLAAVPISELSSLWVRGHATKAGAIVGGVAGAVAGAVVLNLLCEISVSDDGVIGNEGFKPRCAAVGAGLGVLVGGGAGAGVGALIPTWRVRFRTGQ